MAQQLTIFEPAPTPTSAPALPLRPYQREAIEAIDSGLAEGVTRPLVVLPTGCGKTVVFSHLAGRRHGRTLVLAHRDELIQQAADKLRQVNPGADVGIVKAESDQHARPIVVGSVQTLSRPDRLARLRPDFATIIVDESHHATAASYRAVLQHCRSFDAPDVLTVGFTATPDRADGVGLGAIFEKVVYQRGMLEMIRAGYLVDLRAVQVRLQADFNRLHTRAGDFVDSETAGVLLAADAPAHVVAAYRQHAPGRTALVFTPTLAVAEAMADAFTGAGVPAAWLSGDTPRDERLAILARLKAGTVKVVANCAVLVEGFDEPRVDCIAIAKPTKSRPAYQQMIGRGTRTYPGKPDCLILDVVGATARHDLVTTATLFGLPPKDLEKRSVAEAAVAKEAREHAGEAPPAGHLVAADVDLFATRQAKWVPANAGRFVLPTGEGWLALEGEGDVWAVVLQDGRTSRPRTLATGLSLGYAQGVAEDKARALGAAGLIDPHAPWRRQRASENQRQALRRWGVPFPEGITKGEASDLLTATIASRRG